MLAPAPGAGYPGEVPEASITFPSVASFTLVRLAGILGCVAAVWGLAACGGRGAGPAARAPAGEPSSTAPPAAQPSGQPAGTAADATGTAAGDQARPGSDGAAPLTEAECQALLAHVIAVANAAHVKKVAPEEAPTDEQLAAIRARLAPRFVPACLATERRAFACQMQAQSREELLACAEAPAP